MKTSHLLLLLSGGALLSSAADIYVSPCGSDKNSGGSTDKPLRSLTAAQKAVRKLAGGSMSEDVTVHLLEGRHKLKETLYLEAQDSGTNGHKVTWKGSGNATISGGLKLRDWKKDGDDDSGIYVASVPKGTKSRNLYVDGMAAQYARRRIDDREDFNFTAVGMEWSTDKYDWLMTTPGIEDAEVRFIASFTDRYSPIDSVGDRVLRMKNNTWANQIIGWDTVVGPFEDFGVYVQNAKALLTLGGEYYLDEDAGKVYYMPLEGQDMSEVDAYLGIQEALIAIGGTYDDPAHDISFEGLQFSHSTWLRPAKYGYIDQQTCGYIGEDVIYPEFEASRPRWWQMPGAIQISAANHIEMSGCTYTQLGAVGIGIGNDDNAHVTGVGLGASHVSVRDSFFTQVMGGSVLAGGIMADAHHPSDERMTNSHIAIERNVFTNNSALFSSTVNVLTTYIQDSSVSHNDIFDATYSGISHGYGWGANDAGGSADYRKRGLYKYQPEYTTPTTSKNNVIDGNLIHHYGTTHTDLGGIYSLSSSPGTRIQNNYMYDSDYKGLHPDEGTSNITYVNNLCFNQGQLWYDPNDKDPDYRTGNNTLLDNWGRNQGTGNDERYALDGYPDHSGWMNNTFLRNHIVHDVPDTDRRGQRTAFRAGIPPAKRGQRPVSNNPDLADGYLSVKGAEGGRVVSLEMTNFDDVAYTGVTFTVDAADDDSVDLEPVDVPRRIPADDSATATYRLASGGGSDGEVRVAATASYTNPRTGRKGSLKASGTVKLD